MSALPEPQFLREYEWGVLLRWLRPRESWTNKHTGEETTITSFASRIERYPDADSQGFRDEPELVVHHTASVPPGWAGGYGEDARSFIQHWHPATLVALAAGCPPPESSQGAE